MTVETAATFQGVLADSGSTDRPITAADVAAVAKDHGRIFEGLTGVNADGGGGASTNTPHTHIEGGNLLPWAIATQHFGSSIGRDDTDTSPLAAYSKDQDMPYLLSTSATHETINAWYWPIFIPAGWAGKDFFFGLSAMVAGLSPPSMTVTLESWGTSAGTGLSGSQRAYTVPTAVTGMKDVPLLNTLGSRVVSWYSPDVALLFAKITPDVGGLFTVKVTIQLGNGNIPLCGFSDLHLVPFLAFNRGELIQSKPVPGTSNIAVVGDADNFNLYLPADDSLYAADDPMGMGIIINQINSGFLDELATGFPAAGNASLTVSRGHDHANDASAPYYGKALSYCLLSHPFGTISTNAAIHGRFKAPECQAACTTLTTIFREFFYTQVFSGTKKIYCAALVHKSAAKAQAFEVKFITTPEHGASTSVLLQTGNNAADPAGYQLLTDVTNTLDYNSGGRTRLEVQIRESVNNGNTDRLLGIVLWFA